MFSPVANRFGEEVSGTCLNDPGLRTVLSCVVTVVVRNDSRAVAPDGADCWEPCRLEE